MIASKKIARLAACKLKGHVANIEGRCIQCFLEYWNSCPVEMAHQTSIDNFDAMVEAIDAR